MCEDTTPQTTTDNRGSLVVYCAAETARAVSRKAGCLGEQVKQGKRAKGQRSPSGSEPQMAEGVGISKGQVILGWSGPEGSAVHMGLGFPHRSAVKTK